MCAQVIQLKGRCTTLHSGGSLIRGACQVEEGRKKSNDPTYERKLGVGSPHLGNECDVSANGLDAIVDIERFASDIGKR